MKIVFRTLLFHVICIIIFTILYSVFADDYNEKNESSGAVITNNTFIDCLLLSTTIQAGVGISNMYPLNSIGKIILIIQQLIMMSANLFALYFILL
jgi:hypothetical protein